MSHVALRRLMVRLLHDPLLVRTLYDDPDAALRGVELDADERRWLLATPPDAWRADADRPARVLAGLVEEFPAATQLAPERLDDFFASLPFHVAVQERGSLASALSAHLAGHPDPHVAAVARLEGAIAAVRRAAAADAPLAPDTVALPRRSAVLTLPGGTLERREAIRTGRPELPAPDAEEHLLLLGDANGVVSVQEIPDALATVLRAAGDGAPRAAVLAAARAQGAEAGEDDDILDELIADGILRRR